MWGSQGVLRGVQDALAEVPGQFCEEDWARMLDPGEHRSPRREPERLGELVDLPPEILDSQWSRRALSVSAGSNSGIPRLYHLWLHQFGCTSMFTNFKGVLETVSCTSDCSRYFLVVRNPLSVRFQVRLRQAGGVHGAGPPPPRHRLPRPALGRPAVTGGCAAVDPWASNQYSQSSHILDHVPQVFVCCCVLYGGLDT